MASEGGAIYETVENVVAHNDIIVTGTEGEHTYELNYEEPPQNDEDNNNNNTEHELGQPKFNDGEDNYYSTVVTHKSATEGEEKEARSLFSSRRDSEAGEEVTGAYALVKDTPNGGGSEVDLDELVRENTEAAHSAGGEEGGRPEGTGEWEKSSVGSGSQSRPHQEEYANIEEWKGLMEARQNNGGEEDARSNASGASSGQVKVTIRSSAQSAQQSSSTNGVVSPRSSTVPASSGTFVMRSVNKASAFHVLQNITNPDKSQPNPELDELVTIIKSTDESGTSGSVLKQKLQSWITSPLVHRFNQESRENGTETGQTFAPRAGSQVSVTGNRTSYLGSPSSSPAASTPQAAVRSISQSKTIPAPRTSVTTPPTPQARVQASAAPKVNEDVHNVQPTVTQTSLVDEDVFTDPSATVVKTVQVQSDGRVQVDGGQTQKDHVPTWTINAREKQQRSSEIAKAVEAAEFKASVAATTQPVAESKPSVAATTTDPVAVPRQLTISIERPLATATTVTVNGNNSPRVAASPQSETSPAPTSARALLSPGTPDLQTVVSTLAPHWKAEIERRKQTKDYIVTHKPEQPIRLAEMPDWKKQLQEKKKQKGSSSSEYPESDQQPQSAEVHTDNAPAWKEEIKKILKQKSISGEADEVLREKPEWQRLAEEKK